MEPLKFIPTVFTVSHEGFHGITTWNLLTLEGEDPLETVFFHLKGDKPSWSDQDSINENLKNGDFEKNAIENTDFRLEDFDIDISIFETAGEGYQDIKNSLIDEVPMLKFSKKDVINALFQFSESYYGEGNWLYNNNTKDQLIEKLEECSEDYTAIELLESMEKGF